MRSTSTFLLSLLFPVFLFSQVGINTTAPNAQFDVRSSNQAAPANTDGLLIPKVDAFPAANPTALQQGMLVYLTTASGPDAPGFYYWDNPTLSWVSVGSRTGWALSGNPGTVDGTHFVGTTDNIPLSFRVDDEKAGRIDPALENSIFGYQAGNALTTGAQNTVFGNRAYFTATTAANNSAFGRNALYANTAGINNTAIGSESSESNTTGVNNTGIGWRSLRQNTTGSNNTALGVGALEFGSISDQNTAVGRGAMINFGTNRQNVAVGFYALASQTFSNGGATYDSNNTAVGYMSMYSNNPTANGNGMRNSALGLQSLYSNTIGNANTAIGFQSMLLNTTGNGNTAVGDIALVSNTTGNENVAIGGGAAYSNTAASGNVAVGINALRLQDFANGNTAYGTYNTAIGINALFANNPTSTANGTLNTALGAFSLDSNTTGNANTAVGNSALQSIDVNSESTGVGYSAGYNATGGANTFVGSFSGYGSAAAGTGYYNTGVGTASMNSITSGVGNTAAGVSSFRSLTTTNDNTGLGLNSGYFSTGSVNVYVGAYSGVGTSGTSTGSSNAALGAYALNADTSGGGNTAIGYASLRYVTTASESTALGISSGQFATGGQNTFIGAYSGLGASGTSTGVYNVGTGAFSLYSLTSGQGNTGLGTSALRSVTTQSNNTGLGLNTGYNFTGIQNTFVGAYSGQGVSGTSTGNSNTAVGHRSLGTATSGTQNTAMGDYALYNNSTGNGNTAVGAGALDTHSTGADNTGIGRWAGRLFNVLFTGSGNTYLGSGSGSSNSGGSNNTFVGYGSNVSNSALSYATTIGAGSTVNCSNCMALGGNTAASRVHVGVNTNAPDFSLEVNQPAGTYTNGIGYRLGANTWETLQGTSTNYWFAYNGVLQSFISSASGAYTVSDRRYKTAIAPMENILDKVMALEPSRYRFIRNSNGRNSIGFIAQDVEKVFPEVVGHETSNGVDVYGIDYGNLTTVAIKAIQEQQNEIVSIRSQLEKEQQKNKDLEGIVLQLQQRLERLEQR